MFERYLAAPLREALDDTPVVLLHGARQTGKSTLAKAVDARRRYLTLDDATVLTSARSDAAAFVNSLSTPVVIDEVQRAPKLFLAIKASVDRDRRPGHFLLTGSANVMMLPRLADTLAGRMEILTLWPLSQGELEGQREGFVDAIFSASFSPPSGAAPFLERVLQGGYPEAQVRKTPARRKAWFRSYVTTLLQRDVRDLSNVEALTELSRLLTVLAGRAAGQLNVADLSRTLSIPQTSLKRYMSLLEATFLVQVLPAWTAPVSRRLVKSPRLCLSDTGLAAALLDLDVQRLAHDPAIAGALLENFVVMELKKQMGWSRGLPSLWHYRTHDGLEVDVVLESPAGDVVGIEVKSGVTLSRNDWRGLRALREDAGARFRRGVVLYGGSEVVPFGEDLLAVPLSALWRMAAGD